MTVCTLPANFQQSRVGHLRKSRSSLVQGGRHFSESLSNRILDKESEVSTSRNMLRLRMPPQSRPQQLHAMDPGKAPHSGVPLQAGCGRRPAAGFTNDPHSHTAPHYWSRDMCSVQDITPSYALGQLLGRGTFGTTRICTERATGKTFVCKSISKRKLV